MVQIIKDFTELNASQMVSAFNAAQILLGRAEDTFVKKFRNTETAISRLDKTVDELVKMHGIAILTITDDTLMWELKKPTPKPEEKAKTPKASATSLDLDAEIHLLVDTNPKRANSRSSLTFEIYLELAGSEKPEMTGNDYVEAMIKAGFDRKLALSTLHWDQDHGFIQIGSTPEAEPVQTTEGDEKIEEQDLPQREDEDSTEQELA